MESIGHYGGGKAPHGLGLGGNGGTTSTVGAGERRDESASQIRDGVCMTEELVVALLGSIDRVEKRLEAALTPAPPQAAGAGAGNAPTPAISHLLGRVGNCNMALQMAIDRLNRLAQRVEI